MRRVVTAVVVLGLATLAMALQSSSNTTGDKEAIEKAVLKANAEMTQAGNSLDADKFFAFILDSDKGPIIQDGQLFKTRAEALEVVKAGFQAISKAERKLDQAYVTVLSPGVALLTGQGTSKVTLGDGRVMVNDYAVSLVWVLKEGQWRLLHGHYSSPNS